MSSPEGYSQTILLDCNRLASEEFSASNLATNDPAVFTNKVSNGITLDIGDKVSIQGAHIAQRGAGGQVIQFSGDVLGETTHNSTVTTNTSYIGFFEGTFGDPYSPTGFAVEECENVTKRVKVNDNEASVTFSYYKNTNGENCIGLPRNFGSASMGSSAHGGDPHGGGLTNASFWSASDSYAKGLNTYPESASHSYLPDYQLVHCLNACGNNVRTHKLRQDNSRFTLFKRGKTIWRKNHVSAVENQEFLSANSTAKPDPAIHPYHKFKQEVRLSSRVGYNSPSTVASEITDELLQSEDPILIGSRGQGTVVVNSTLYKAIPCANYQNFNASKNISFFNASTKDHLPVGVNASSIDHQDSNTYLNNYNYIGFKRPELVVRGRELNAYHGNKLREGIAIGASGTATLKTNFSWNEITLQKLKVFFEAQQLYPELSLEAAFSTVAGITNYDALPENIGLSASQIVENFTRDARFLHIGISGSGNALSDTDALGSDMYNVSHADPNGNHQAVRANASNQTSNPVFFYFNHNSSHLTSNDSIGDRLDNLVYGFARRHTIGGVHMVEFVTEPIGGIPLSYFQEQGNVINENTKIGYDYHFTGYGNTAIMLSSGFHPLQLYGHQRATQGLFISQVYVGANNALFNFNTTESRFEISNLHSAEKVGNFYNAGDPTPASDVFGPPASAQAGVDCFKINKQMKFDTWSPDLQPYATISLSTSATTGEQKTFIPMNKLLEKGQIYDQHSGVAIEDMGVPEDMWVDSIWGLLGFEYGQFNASGSNVKNLNIRFSENTENASVLTTNANVTSESGQQFSVNVFGTNMFNNNLNSEIAYFDIAKNISQALTGANHEVYPPIVVSETDLSSKITANELPRKILRGYFLINSDILDTANYYQTANPLQTMAIVGKYNGANDFVQYDGGGATFTVTRKKTITSIKTQILDPDGGPAQVGDNSGIVYRIDKQIKTDLKFAENLMAGVYGKPPGS